MGVVKYDRMLLKNMTANIIASNQISNESIITLAPTGPQVQAFFFMSKYQ